MDFERGAWNSGFRALGLDFHALDHFFRALTQWFYAWAWLRIEFVRGTRGFVH
jgi:hypothetical protein